MRSRAHKPLLAAAGVGVLLASASCAKSGDASREQAVSNAAARFHENLKASKFEDIYAGASPDLRAGQKKDEFIQRLRDVRARFGELVRVEESRFMGRAEEKEVNWVITFFDIDGASEDGSEMMAWDVSGDEIRLERYSVTFKDGKESVNLTP